MIKLLYTLAISLILTLFYAFFTQFYPAINAVAIHGDYAIWAWAILVAADFTLILIPLLMMRTLWNEYAKEQESFYARTFKKISNGVILMLSIIIITYTWANYYENLHP